MMRRRPRLRVWDLFTFADFIRDLFYGGIIRGPARVYEMHWSDGTVTQLIDRGEWENGQR